MKPNELSDTILEAFDGAASPSADDPWCIPNVKILGMTSKNAGMIDGRLTKGRRYTEQCLQEAVGLYEGKAVYQDHAKPGVVSRDPGEVLGYLKGVRHVPGDGLRGNLHFVLRGQLAESVKIASKENPSLYGLSHDIPKGQSIGVVDPSGFLVVHKINLVDHVALVTKPGTTGGLHEGVQPVEKITFKQFAMKLPALPSEVKRFDTILESMGEAANIEIVPDESWASSEQKLKGGFKAVLAGILESYQDDDAKLDQHMKTATAARHAMLTGEEIKKSVAPTITESVEPMKLGNDTAKLLQSHKVTITAELLESFSGMTKEQAVPLLESMKAKDAKIIELEKRVNLVSPEDKTRSAGRTGSAAITESVTTDKDGNPVKPKFVPRYLSASRN